MTGISAEQIEAELRRIPSVAQSADQRAVSKEWVDRRQRALIAFLGDFHKKFPAVSGAPLSIARLGLDDILAALVFTDLSAVRVRDGVVALANHQAHFSAPDQALLERIAEAFRQGGFQPPSPLEVATSTAAESKKFRELLESLIKSGKLVRIHDEVVFHGDVIRHIRTSLAQHKGRQFSVPEFKSWINISRKYAIPLLEYLDRHKITRRVGDLRVIL
jgi:selenocysteine-specific elongation factor